VIAAQAYSVDGAIEIWFVFLSLSALAPASGASGTDAPGGEESVLDADGGRQCRSGGERDDGERGSHGLSPCFTRYSTMDPRA